MNVTLPSETRLRSVLRLSYWRNRLSQREDQVFLILTVIIGAFAGLAVVAFILITERLGARLYPPGVPNWRRVLGPILGALSMGYVLARFFSDARTNGVLQTRAALASSDGRITLHSIVGKFLCTSVTLASGIPLGPEGPSVAVGAGIASVLGRKLGLSNEKVRALIPVGAAAAISAAFNTPIAAVIFSLDDIVGDLHAPVLGSVVLASATSWMVLHLSLGNDPLFRVPQYALFHPIEFVFYAILGCLGGVFGGAFIRSVLWLRAKFKTFPARTVWVQPLAGGIVVGVAGLVVPQVLGVGYVHINSILNGQMAIRIAAILVLLKLVTVVFSVSSGNAGGIFAPTLFVGAMLGGTVGGVAHYFFPSLTASPGAYALVGMGVAFAGMVRSPMTSVILVFEVTRDYAIIVPLMIANLISYFVSQKLSEETLYEGLARQDGVHLPTARSHAPRKVRQVAQIMRPTEHVLAEDMTVNDAMTFISASGLRSWPVLTRGRLSGVATVQSLQHLQAEGKGDLPLGQVIQPLNLPHLHPDHSLELALERMGAAGVDALPVIDRFDAHHIVGVVYLSDVLAAYHLHVDSAPASSSPDSSNPPPSQGD